jgi:hypothetical protein
MGPEETNLADRKAALSPERIAFAKRYRDAGAALHQFIVKTKSRLKNDEMLAMLLCHTGIKMFLAQNPGDGGKEKVEEFLYRLLYLQTASVVEGDGEEESG